MSAYHEYLQLFNTGFEIGVNGFALRIAGRVAYLPFACIRCRCLYPEKLWLYLHVWTDDRRLLDRQGVVMW